MFRFSLTTNDVQAWMRTGKLVFFKNSWTNSICLYRHALKKENSCCVCQNADCTFNVAPYGTYEFELRCQCTPNDHHSSAPLYGQTFDANPSKVYIF